MAQKYRISTNIGKDQLVRVELQQKFDILEILSLKFTQKELYTSFASDYGVVVGRITANNGLGIPNAKVSIFIPLDDVDSTNPVISTLYPYTEVTDINVDGYRYNLLPSRQQHGGHNPTGTFPDQSDILNREEVLEVFEKYYKFTVKTNISGDFMIWGVPTGQQVLHFDVDTSDIGCFSLRPDDFIRQGAGVDKFKNSYEFKSSSDLSSLPQIITFNKTIQVYPLWGNTDFSVIGISRTDFDLTQAGIKIEPKALVIGGTFTDTGKNSVDKNCIPHKNMGTKCSLTTHRGKIEAVRFTPTFDTQHRPILEHYDLHEDIPDDGSFVFSVPMNMDFLYTNEFGEFQYTNNPNKGVPTSACYRFRFTMKDEGLERVRARASYLVPNIKEHHINDNTRDDSETDKSYYFGTDYSGYPINAQTDILHGDGGFFYPQDYFYKFHYGKVYTVSSFHGTLIHDAFLSANRYLGIKDLSPAEDKDCTSNVLTPPVNFGTKHTGLNFPVLISQVVAFIQFIFSLIKLVVFEFVATFLFSVGQALYRIYFGWPFNWRPFDRIGETFESAALQVASAGSFTLPLTIYDECELCTNDDTSLTQTVNVNNYCKIGELAMTIMYDNGDSIFFYITGMTESLNGFMDPNIPARDTDIGCANSYHMNPSAYTDMNTMIYTDPISSITEPQFEILFGSYNNSPLNIAQFPINSDTLTYTDAIPVSVMDPLIASIIGIPANSMGFFITKTQLNNLFGITDIKQGGVNGTTLVGKEVFAAVYDLSKTHSGTTVYSGVTLLEGCAMYNRTYDKSIPKEAIWLHGQAVYGDPALPSKPITNNNFYTNTTKFLDNVATPGIYEQPITDTSNILGDKHLLPGGGVDWYVGGECWYMNNQIRLPHVVRWGTLGTINYTRKTKTGFSEFRHGVFTIIPSINGISPYNASAIREWYRRKLVGLSFCGGVVNYAYVDNWLSGSLYFYQFKKKMKGAYAKMCQLVAKYIPSENRVYYRSAAYNHSSNTWGIDNSGHKMLGHPTTMVDLGPRDEFIKEICIDDTLDPNCSVARSIGPSSFKSFSELVAFAINYRMDTTNDAQTIDDFFNRSGAEGVFGGLNVFDGDVTQLISINSEAGIEGFDLQNPKYIGYNIGILDPVDEKVVFTGGTGSYGPVPITLDYNSDGIRIRECLNTPGMLTEASQPVPFFLWDRKGKGFGPYNKYSSSQSWDYASGHIEVQPLQGMHNISNPLSFTGINGDPYLLPPMSYDFNGLIVTGLTQVYAEEFDVVVLIDSTFIDDAHTLAEYVHTAYNQFKLLIATTGTITEPTAGRFYIRLKDQWVGPISWDPTLDYSIWPTVDPYSDQNNNKQILSTPFTFYFGLRPGSTGVDKLIERFGPKGAFPTVN